ncbi:putative membrane protein [Bartonella vinsonii subsp. berkhoffii str. Winnie]|nr:putative membrane protein [Bartonella vinsonii subsp. berkhoffii str. Winnie]
MFKLFKSCICIYVFTAFILCLIQTIESHRNIMKNYFQAQEGAPVAAIAATGKNAAIEAVEVVKVIDMAVIRDAEGQDGLAFEKIENVSLFAAFWGG